MVPGNPDGVVSQVPSPIPREDLAVPSRQADSFQGLVLDNSDPVENAMNEIIRVYRFRKGNMSVEGDIYATFRQSAQALDIPSFGVPEAILHYITREQANINAMRRSGTLFNRENEEARGAYLEMAFYACLLYSWIKGYMRQ
jgi:hypothetical protein